MRRHWWAWTLLIAVAGCSSASPNSRPRDQVPAGTLVIGFPNDLARNREMSNGARIAVREIDGLGGIDGALEIRLIVRDTRGDPGRAGRLAARLIAEGARVLVLPCDPAEQRAIAEAARHTKTILFATCNYDPRLAGRTPLLWAVGMGANLEAAALAEYARERGYERLYLAPAREESERRLARYFAVAAAAQGIELARAPTRVDSIVSPLPAGPTVELARRHPALPVLATDLVDSRRILTAAGVTFTTFGYPDPGFATDEFYERYRSYYHVRPAGSSSALAYVAIKLLDRAVNRANSAAPALVARELRGLEVRSALGELAYPDSGDRNPEVKATVLRVEDGRLQLLDRIQPDEVPAP